MSWDRGSSEREREREREIVCVRVCECVCEQARASKTWRDGRQGRVGGIPIDYAKLSWDTNGGRDPQESEGFQLSRYCMRGKTAVRTIQLIMSISE